MSGSGILSTQNRGSVTINEFVDKLAETPDGWCIRRGELIRLRRNTCPICAVLGGAGSTITSEKYDRLGLSLKDGDAIALAADGWTGFDPALRQRLLAVTIERKSALTGERTP